MGIALIGFFFIVQLCVVPISAAIAWAITSALTRNTQPGRTFLRTVCAGLVFYGLNVGVSFLTGFSYFLLNGKAPLIEDQFFYHGALLCGGILLPLAWVAIKERSSRSYVQAFAAIALLVIIGAILVWLPFRNTIKLQFLLGETSGTDVQVCDDIKAINMTKAISCYAETAVRAKNIEICDGSPANERCMSNYALTFHAVSACDRIQAKSNGYIDYRAISCYEALRISKEEICAKMQPVIQAKAHNPVILQDFNAKYCGIGTVKEEGPRFSQ